ncbi:ATPase AAA [Egicoccus halophilus]|uniref:ATPase AAA n=2 Tax=Egicoccus halophilus TaxID=1670830 RepID=A0A8J3ESG2_9ACTN|nr:ATPase AAA [Egicoccus halophilus]
MAVPRPLWHNIWWSSAGWRTHARLRGSDHPGTTVRAGTVRTMSGQLFDDAPATPASLGPGVAADRSRPSTVPAGMPLAARLRPRNLDEYVGQLDALGPGKPLRAMLDQGELRSLLLWGPPGVGKTSLATVIAAHVDASWTELSAVTAGVKDVRRIVDEGRGRLELRGRRTVLFVDEIHRFNKSQQDALLPGVEAGWVTLIGATTENPFFELNPPLLSRCQLVRLQTLTDEDLRVLLQRAVADPERGFGGRVALADDAVAHLVHVGDGDARAALTALEIAAAAAGVTRPGSDGPSAELSLADVADAMQRFRYDKASDHHYDIVSAFIKSLRGSDPDAAVYWLLRMLEGGEDPRFVARRMVIFASEDVGLADRQALPLAVAAFDALDKVGLPEARYALTHAAIALAVAPKSNSVTRAIGAGLEAVRRHGNAAVPPHLRDAHYRGARTLGHGVGYDYPHDHPSGFAPGQRYLPDELGGSRLYEPSRHGHEAAVADRVASLRQQARGRPADSDTRPGDEPT